jgi:ribosomal protein S18 acetylase RimI-like enzyme
VGVPKKLRNDCRAIRKFQGLCSEDVRSAEEIAATLIVVDAKDGAAVAFYQRFGFALLPKLKSRLFLPMATASKL